MPRPVTILTGNLLDGLGSYQKNKHLTFTRYEMLLVAKALKPTHCCCLNQPNDNADYPMIIHMNIPSVLV